MIELFGAAFLLLALLGSGYLVLAGLQVRRFLGQAAAPADAPTPGVTVLKPLHGLEPALEATLETLFVQDYAGPVQIVFGLQDPSDPARTVAEQLKLRYPQADVAVVVDPRLHGSNHKISNLINMAVQARHDVLVLSDSDIAVPLSYLRQVTAPLADPQVGVVSCPYYGEAKTGVWSRLSAMGLSYQFLPSVVVGVSLGLANPCMGSTIALRREVLARIGGFEAFADLLADDYAVGAAVRAAGYRARVLPLLVAHGCAEQSFGELFRHELRWASTVRGIDPVGFFGSGLTHAVMLAIIGALLAPSWAALAIFAVALACRLWLIAQIDKVVATRGPRWWLLPARDILSFAVFIGSFFVRVVEWRGARFRVDDSGGLSRI